MNQQQQQQPEAEAYGNFINSINSNITRKEYNLKFDYFMQFCSVKDREGMLLISESDLESKIRNYIVYLRYDRKLSPGTVSA